MRQWATRIDKKSHLNNVCFTEEWVNEYKRGHNVFCYLRVAHSADLICCHPLVLYYEWKTAWVNDEQTNCTMRGSVKSVEEWTQHESMAVKTRQRSYSQWTFWMIFCRLWSKELKIDFYSSKITIVKIRDVCFQGPLICNRTFAITLSKLWSHNVAYIAYMVPTREVFF